MMIPRRGLGTKLCLGKDLKGQPYYIEPLHLYIGARTGEGKSKLKESLMRQLVWKRSQPTIILIDTAGSTAEQMENYITRYNLEDRAILFYPQLYRQEGLAIGYDPTGDPQLPIAYRAKKAVAATLTALQIDQQEKTSIYYIPELEVSLFNFFYAAMEAQGLTFSEAKALIEPQDNPLRPAILERLKNPSIKAFWQYIERLPPERRKQALGILPARLHPFLSSEPIRYMLSQTQALNLRETIERGSFIIANLQPFREGLTAKDSILLAAWLLNDILTVIFSRKPYTGKEVWIFCEEINDGYLTDDAAYLMRGSRKFNTHFVLSGQSLTDLRTQNPRIFNQVITNADKIVFGGLPEQDLEILAPEFYAEELNLKEIKQEIERTYFEPKEGQRTIHSRGWGWSEFEGVGQVMSASSGSTVIPQEGLLTPDIVHHHSSEGSVENFSSGQGYFESEQKSVIPFYEYIKRKELSSREFFGLEEQLFKARVRLKSLKPRYLAFKQRGARTVILKTLDTPDIPRIPKYLKDTRQQIFSKAGCYATLEEIEKEEKERLKSLEGQAEKEPTYKQAYDPEKAN